MGYSDFKEDSKEFLNGVQYFANLLKNQAEEWLEDVNRHNQHINDGMVDLLYGDELIKAGYVHFLADLKDKLKDVYWLTNDLKGML